MVTLFAANIEADFGIAKKFHEKFCRFDKKQ